MPFASDADCLLHSHSSLDHQLLSSCHIPGTVFSDRDRQFLSVSQTDAGVGRGEGQENPGTLLPSSDSAFIFIYFLDFDCAGSSLQCMGFSSCYAVACSFVGF